MKDNTLIALHELGLRKGAKTLLSNINLEINTGKIVSVVGPNGAGKTSLLKTILGFEKDYSGSIEKANNLNIGYMPQAFTANAFLPITVKDFLNQAVDNASETFAKLNITSLLNTPLQALSGGEKQRILLARALLKKPQLLVLDEPTQGVDIHGQAELYDIIDCARHEFNCGVLLVSHDLHIVMAKTDEVFCLNTHVCCHGHPEEVSKHPEYIALFGKAHAESLAVYSHHHDHHHDFHGHAHDGECSHD